MTIQTKYTATKTENEIRLLNLFDEIKEGSILEVIDERNKVFY